MIRTAKEKDIIELNKLGILLNDNFTKTYNNILPHQSQYIFDFFISKGCKTPL